MPQNIVRMLLVYVQSNIYTGDLLAKIARLTHACFKNKRLRIWPLDFFFFFLSLFFFTTTIVTLFLSLYETLSHAQSKWVGFIFMFLLAMLIDYVQRGCFFFFFLVISLLEIPNSKLEKVLKEWGFPTLFDI